MPVLERRKDHDTRDRISKLQSWLKRAIATLAVFTTASFAVGGYAIEREKSLLHDERARNSLANCLKDSRKNLTFREFVLFASGGEAGRNGPLYTEALKDWPVQTRAQCEEQVRRMVNQ